MKRLLWLVLLAPTLLFAQQNRVVDPNNPPTIPVGATNVPLSMDTFGRILTNSGNITGTAPFRVGQTNVPLSLDGRGRVLVNDTGGGGGDGVTKIIAGTNVTISPTSGVGDVTINSSGGGGGTPGGSDTQMQFNDAGSFGGAAGVTYNKTTAATLFSGETGYNYTVMASTVISATLPAETRTLTTNEAESFSAAIPAGYSKRVRWTTTTGAWLVTFSSPVIAYGLGDISGTGFTVQNNTTVEATFIGTGGAPFISGYPRLVSLTSDVSGVLGIINGGTNRTTGTLAYLGDTQSFTGINTFAPTARSSGNAPYLVVTTPADTLITAGSNAVGVSFTSATRQHASNTAVTTQTEHVFSAPTYSFATSGGVITDAVNVDIVDPIAGTNATLTNKYGLRVNNIKITGTANGNTIATGTGTLKLNSSTLVSGVSGALTESAGATTIDCATSSAFTLTLNANLTTVTLSNFSDGQTVVVAVTNTASNYTVTWGNSILWVGGSQPVQTVGAHTDVWTLIKFGSSIYGSVVQNF